jgi:adenylyl- and sulfurtransferase ThiI
VPSVKELRVKRDFVARLKGRVKEHLATWKLEEHEQGMLERLLSQANEAESRGDLDKAVTILSGILSAFNLKDDEDDRRTKGAATNYRRVSAARH